MTAEKFLVDVANHKMTVRLDNGIYRHIHFGGHPHAWNMWFGIVTWPGYLTICGDMGTWTFARVEDMFSFFRNDKLRINCDYWAEKIQNGQHGGRDETKVFYEDLFKAQLLTQLTNYYDLQGEDLVAVTAALQEDVLRQEGEYDLLIAARDFSCQMPGRAARFHFDTCELPDGKAYSYHFVWCLYAIVWGIQQYDAARAQV
jgi:hypothetical protein